MRLSEETKVCPLSISKLGANHFTGAHFKAHWCGQDCYSLVCLSSLSLSSFTDWNSGYLPLIIYLGKAHSLHQTSLGLTSFRLHAKHTEAVVDLVWLKINTFPLNSDQEQFILPPRMSSWRNQPISFQYNVWIEQLRSWLGCGVGPKQNFAWWNRSLDRNQHSVFAIIRNLWNLWLVSYGHYTTHQIEYETGHY
jgi:hypothetical protein